MSGRPNCRANRSHCAFYSSAAHLQRVDGGGDHEGGEGDTQTYDIPYRNQRTLNSQTFGLNALREQMWMRMQPTGGGAQQNGGSYARVRKRVMTLFYAHL
jgi:hypothetical protein